MEARSQRTKEEIVRIWNMAAYPENLNEVVELAVDVADDGDGGADVDDIALAHE